MSGIVIVTADPTPPFEQLRSQIAAKVASGDLSPGTRLAPVRTMAADLGLAANTVARAYRELEADGVVATHGRRGTVVAGGAAGAAVDERLAAGYATAARRAGLTLPEATRLLERAWTGGPAR